MYTAVGILALVTMAIGLLIVIQGWDQRDKFVIAFGLILYFLVSSILIVH